MQDDEFAGQGGSYRINPQTGKRELVERTQTPIDVVVVVQGAIVVTEQFVNDVVVPEIKSQVESTEGDA